MIFQYDDNVELLSDTIPENTTHLFFGVDFNQSIVILPSINKIVVLDIILIKVLTSFRHK